MNFATNAPPDMRQVSNVPQQPAANTPVTITAKVTDPNGVSSVSAAYQLVDAGNYIAMEDAAYNNPANWTTVAMHDDGLNGDAVAGDSVYTVVLPASLQVNRRLVRYRITSTIPSRISHRPISRRPNSQFRLFRLQRNPRLVRRASARSSRSRRAGEHHSPSTLASVPVYTFITRKIDHDNSQHIPGRKPPPTTVANISGPAPSSTTALSMTTSTIGPAAASGVYAMGKNMWKFAFNRGHDFQAKDANGNPYPATWKKLNFGADTQQGDIGMRGSRGCSRRSRSSSSILQAFPRPQPSRSASALSKMLRTPEILPTNMTTTFRGLYLAVEQMDGRFLDAHGLPDGNLYKMEGGTGPGGGTLNNQGPTQPSDNSDLVNFVNTLNANPTDQWIRDNVDLNSFYSFQAVVEMVHHWDIGFGKNYFFYHNPTTNKWQILPWDTDLTWFVNYEPGSGDQDAFARVILTRPTFQAEYRNRVRELRDLIFNSGEIGKLADAYAALVNPAGVGPPSFRLTRRCGISIPLSLRLPSICRRLAQAPLLPQRHLHARLCRRSRSFKNMGRGTFSVDRRKRLDACR